MMRKIGLLVSLALLMGMVACDSGDGLTVTLDPDFRLLRRGLPAPEHSKPQEGDALMAELRGWGRGAWLPDSARGRMVEGKLVPEEIRFLPVRSMEMVADLSLLPAAGDMQGHAVVTVFAEDGDIAELRFYLSAADIDMLEAVSGPEAHYSYEAPVLTVTPVSPVAQGEAAGRWVWQWEVQELLNYYDEDGEDHALVPDEAIPMEPRIVYIKGAWVLRMLEGMMGTTAMDQLLFELREEHRFAALSTQTLVDKATLIADREMGWFFEQWLYGQGLMNLDEDHEVVGDQVLLTISQQSVWKGNPPQYFQMPVEILLEKKDLSRRHEVEVLQSEEEFPLSMP